MDSNLTIQPITAINVQRVLSSTKLSTEQKAEYIRENEAEIKQVMKSEITKEDFVYLMKNRPLIRFRPVRNSFTKRGDKILLAKSLGIKTSEVEDYIDNIVETNFDIQNNDYTKEDIAKTEEYVFRHGTKDEVIAYLDYELSNVKTVLKKLYKLFEYNDGGIAGYFSRPIHRLDDRTLRRMYDTVYKRLNAGCAAGEYSQDECNSKAKWALVKIHQIQNNSKLIRAAETYRDLTHTW